jgi:hypothetical protein
VKNLYHVNYKSLKKEIEDMRRWKDLSCLWIGRIKIIKMAIQPKPINILNAITSKISITLFTKKEKSILKFLWKHKRP